MGVGHAQHLDVVDVAALAGDKTSVFLAHNACANAFNAHVLISLPEFLMSACLHQNEAV
jgi:cytosine/adenosine deaminase-related metal-dependent hydrolase